MPAEKPPLGAMTRKRHAELRVKELARAIHLYIEGGFPLRDYHQLSKWTEELDELLRVLHEDKRWVETEKPKELVPSPEMVSCDTTLEFMALATQALRQIYYLLYMPDGNPDMPELLMVALIKFEGKLRKSMGG